MELAFYIYCRWFVFALVTDILLMDLLDHFSTL